jgi:hypothetical protein
LNSDVYWITCEMDVTCDLLCWITTILTCMLVVLKSLVISLDYRSYMGSSARIWSLRWLFLYLCSYNLDGSVTPSTLQLILVGLVLKLRSTFTRVTILCHFSRQPLILCHFSRQPFTAGTDDSVLFEEKRKRCCNLVQFNLKARVVKLEVLCYMSMMVLLFVLSLETYNTG